MKLVLNSFLFVFLFISRNVLKVMMYFHEIMEMGRPWDKAWEIRFRGKSVSHL